MASLDDSDAQKFAALILFYSSCPGIQAL
ncbi:uncharacterized protein METZ01_LOCUS517330, partial [marine metagenome]